MFIGEFQYRVDDKGRVPIPPKFRHELKDGLILLPGLEKCILAYSLPEWEKLSKALAGSGSIPPDKMRRLNRAIFAQAFDLELDRQGRIALPAPLKQYAGIDDEAVVTGVNTNLEIWNRTLWEEQKTASREQAWQTIESLERH